MERKYILLIYSFHVHVTRMYVVASPGHRFLIKENQLKYPGGSAANKACFFHASDTGLRSREIRCEDLRERERERERELAAKVG